MKRMSALLLSLMLALTAFGCGSEEDVRGEITNTAEEEDSESSNTSESEDEISSDEETVSEEEFSLGTNDGATYENEFIGLGYRLNDGWTFYTDEQIKELNSAAADMAGEEYQELVESATLVYDMFASDSEGMNNVNVNLEKVNAVQLLALDIAQNFESVMPTMKTSYENMGYTNFNYEISTINIDGKELDACLITAEINDVSLYQTLFAVKCNGYLANIAVTTYFDDTKSEILDNFYWME